MTTTLPPRFAEYMQAFRANYGRAGYKLSPPEVRDGVLHLSIAQGPTTGRLFNSRELQEKLRKAVESIDGWAESGLDLHIEATPADRWTLTVDDEGMRLRRLVPPWQEARICAGPGEHAFELDQGVYHLEPIGEVPDKRMGSMVRTAKQRIIQDKLFHVLPK